MREERKWVLREAGDYLFDVEELIDDKIVWSQLVEDLDQLADVLCHRLDQIDRHGR